MGRKGARPGSLCPPRAAGSPEGGGRAVRAPVRCLPPQVARQLSQMDGLGGLRVVALHGDLSQQRRDVALDMIKQGRAQARPSPAAALAARAHRGRWGVGGLGAWGWDWP